MSPSDSSNGINAEILRQLQAQGRTLGNMEGHLDSIDGRLDGIDRRLDAGSSQMRGYGSAIQQLEWRQNALERAVETSDRAGENRARHISEQIQAFNAKYQADVITGVHHIAEERGSNRAWSKMAKVALTLWGVLVAAVTTYFTCFYNRGG